MRSFHRIAALVVVMCCVLAGCRAEKQDQPQTAAPASEDRVRMIRQNYQSIDPAARVGLVIAVRPEYRLAAVSDVAVEDFSVGDVVVFVDANEEPLVNGTVVAKTEDAIHVKYNEPKSGGRAPNVGDLAVRFQK